MASTKASLQALVLEAAAINGAETCTLRQKDISAMIDAASHRSLLLAADASTKAHMALSSVPGAGVWLTAPPCQDGREMDAALFRIAAKRRIRCPTPFSEAPCPCCGQILDIWGDHALVCPCQGDRTVRHNTLRNIGCEEAGAAGLRPERERAGLLPGRPTADGAPPVATARRPADIWVPRGPSGGNTAFDFGVTCGMQAACMRQAAEDPQSLIVEYEEKKKQHLNTKEACRTVGLRFTPRIVAAHAGGLSQTTRGVIDWIAASLAAAKGSDKAGEALRIAQRISIALHRENARAILRRIPAAEPQDAASSAWANSHDAHEVHNA